MAKRNVWLTVLTLVLSILLAVGIGTFIRIRSRIADYGDKFGHITKGMTYASVVRIMGTPDDDFTDTRNLSTVYWEDSALPAAEQGNVRRTLTYQIMPGFFYRVHFNADEEVIGKHRYD